MLHCFLSKLIGSPCVRKNRFDMVVNCWKAVVFLRTNKVVDGLCIAFFCTVRLQPFTVRIPCGLTCSIVPHGVSVGKDGYSPRNVVANPAALAVNPATPTTGVMYCPRV